MTAAHATDHAADHDELALHCDARRDATVDALDADAAQSTDASGHLWHGRLPCGNVDAFNPSVVARVAIREPSRGGYPIGTGLPGVWL